MDQTQQTRTTQTGTTQTQTRLPETTSTAPRYNANFLAVILMTWIATMNF